MKKILPILGVSLTYLVSSIAIAKSFGNSKNKMIENDIVPESYSMSTCIIDDTTGYQQTNTDNSTNPKEVRYVELEKHMDKPRTCSLEESAKIIEEGKLKYKKRVNLELIDNQRYIKNIKEHIINNKDENKKVSEDQSYIYHILLNSIDYFHTAEGSMTYAFNVDPPIVIDFKTNLDSQHSFESLSQTGSYNRINYTTKNKKYIINQDTVTYEVFNHSEPDYFIISDNDRFLKLDNGENLSIFREDLTNLSIAGNSCLFPQAYAMKYLNDFSLWEISNIENKCNCECAVINGRFEDSLFKMYVDLETGILLNFELYNDNGKLTGYVDVNEIKIDNTIDIQEPDLDKYTMINS